METEDQVQVGEPAEQVNETTEQSDGAVSEKGQPAEGEEPKAAESSKATESSVDMDWEHQYKSLLPDYTRTKQRLAELERQHESTQQSQQAPKDDPVDQAITQIEPYLKARGFLTRDEVNKMMADNRTESSIRQEVDRLAGKYDGKDGRPAFKPKEVIDFVLEQGGTLMASDLESAYKIKHEKELIDWYVGQADSKKKGTFSEKSDSSGADQSQPSDAEMIRKSRQSGDFSGLLKRKIKLPSQRD